MFDSAFRKWALVLFRVAIRHLYIHSLFAVFVSVSREWPIDSISIYIKSLPPLPCLALEEMNVCYGVRRVRPMILLLSFS
jgi:hypothetical protein